MNFLGPDESADFTSRLRRQGGTTNAQSQPFQFPSTAPTGNFKPQGITPPGPNHSQQWFGDRPMGGFQHPQNGGVVPPGPWGGGKSFLPAPGSEPYRDPITGAQVGLDNPPQQMSGQKWLDAMGPKPPGEWRMPTDQERFLQMTAMAGGGGFQRPGGGYDSSGINPGGMYGGPPIQGGPFGPPRPDMTGGPVGDPAYPAKSDGRPWSYENRNEMQRPGGGYGPYNGYGTPGNGGVVPPGPHGGGPKGFPGMDPSIYPSGWNGYVHPQQTRGQWQQNRLGNPGPQIPQESPIFPTNGWGSNNQGW